MSKPVIAAISGWALGFGLELAMACDLRIAAAGAKLGQPETKLGIIPGAGGTQRLPALVGLARAKELIFTGESITAEQAHQMGLVNRVVERAQLLEESLKLADLISQTSPQAVKVSKAVINQSFRPSGYELERESFASCFGTPDQKEGMRAFFEKRRPRFE
jgi:enoyl-CoA hydratase